MCDYSLESYQSRDAVEGERLVTRRFQSGSQGFVSPDCPEVAVCLEEGTQLVLRGLPERLQQEKEVGEEVIATFAYLNRSQRRWWAFWSLDSYYRDGLVFPNGHSIAINKLPEGLEADVLTTVITTPVSEQEPSDKEILTES
jgi:hypothetical protein